MNHPSFYASRLRSESYDCIVVSPHLDDAVYSMAGTMLAARAAGRRVLVVTVFGHGKAEPTEGAGRFDDYASREREDRAAMNALDVDYVWLNRPELIFRDRSASDVVRYLVPFASVVKTSGFDDVLAALRGAIDSLADADAEIHFPLAVGSHPDHRIVFEAGRAIAETRAIRFYEDVPYALFPTFVSTRLSHLSGLRGPSVVRAAWEMAAFVSRGLARALLLLPLVVYVTLLSAAFLVVRAVRGEGLPLVAEERDVASFVARKAHAMRLYESQTPLFFREPARLESQLPTTRGVHVERSWRLAA